MLEKVRVFDGVWSFLPSQDVCTHGRDSQARAQRKGKLMAASGLIALMQAFSTGTNFVLLEDIR